MKIIGKRKENIEVPYIFTLILGVLLAFSSLVIKNESMSYVFMSIILGVMLIGISAVIIVGYFSTANYAIVMLNNEEIQINKKIRILLSDMVDISYKRARVRGIKYKWGSVTITTYRNNYTVNYLNECEKVAKVLTSLMDNKQQ